MSSLISEEVLFTEADKSIIRPNVNKVEVDNVITNKLNVSFINNTEIIGETVSADATQLIQNKSFVDTNCFVVDISGTKKINFDSNGTAGTTATMRFEQPSDSIYTVPNTTTSSFVMTEGDITVNGEKTFNDLVADSLKTDQITTRTTGTSINNIKLYESNTIGNNAVIQPTSTDNNLCLYYNKAIIVGAPPDNTTTGGNARGINAIDLQKSRDAPTQVASGDYSVILGGNKNTASANNTIVAGTFANAIHAGSLCFSDDQDLIFNSTKTKQFNARYENGFNFIGKELNINNTDKIYVISKQSTTDSIPKTIISIETSSGHAYLLHYKIISGTNSDIAAFTGYIKAKNISNVLTIGMPFNRWEDIDSSLVGISVDVAIDGTNIIINVVGLNATSIEWNCAVNSTEINIKT